MYEESHPYPHFSLSGKGRLRLEKVVVSSYEDLY